MEDLPSTTEGRVALIAQGSLGSEGALNSEIISQLLNATFDAGDYLSVLRGHPDQQQYINGLYAVHHPYSVKFPFT